MHDKEEIWIRKGYETFALQGEGGLKVEQLAKEVGISKSSFYHHFADMGVFIEKLLQHHLVVSKVIAQKERNARTINPELIQILLSHKIDLLFNRQLRINSNKPSFKDTLIKSNVIVGTDFIHLWLTDTQIILSTSQIEGLFELALENFYLQINNDNLTQPWLEAYFENLKRITGNFGQPIVR